MLSAVDAASRRCGEEISRGGFDILLATTCRLSGVAPIACYTNLPGVMYIQEPWRQLYEALPKLPWADVPTSSGGTGAVKERLRDFLDTRSRRHFARHERDSAAAFDLLLVNSLFSRESILRAYGLDARVCYQGVDLEVFQDRQQVREGFVLGVGSYTYHKNIPFAIESVAAMAEPRPRLIWVGNGGPKDHMTALTDLSSKRGVQFEPRFGVSEQELVDLYNRASVLLCAPRLEPFGLVALEANACGLPVVTVAEGGLRETVIHELNGLVAEPFPEAVAEGVGRLFSDRGLAAKLGRQGREWVKERWSLAASIERLEGFLCDAAGSDRAA